MPFQRSLNELLTCTPRQPKLPDLINGLRQYPLDPGLVPLSADRFPFRTLPDQTILAACRWALEYPEKLGRLSHTIRRFLGLSSDCPVHYVIKESHLDLTSTPHNLPSHLIELGFEPDHFAELNPPEYQWCYTLKFEIPRTTVGEAKRVSEIDRLLLEQSTQAEELVSGHPGCFGYLEVESYSSKNKRVYNFRPVTGAGLAHFPFSQGAFEPFDLPRNSRQALSIGLPLNAHKAVDVHVKLPTPGRGRGFEEADSTEMRTLRGLFLGAGFYEIYSEAGNYIYTVQSFDIPVGKLIFDALDAFAVEWGGLAGLKLEICKHFWRNWIDTQGTNIQLAPIPPVTRLRKNAR
jgi:hypothetical protein